MFEYLIAYIAVSQLFIGQISPTLMILCWQLRTNGSIQNKTSAKHTGNTRQRALIAQTNNAPMNAINGSITNQNVG